MRLTLGGWLARLPLVAAIAVVMAWAGLLLIFWESNQMMGQGQRTIPQWGETYTSG